MTEEGLARELRRWDVRLLMNAERAAQLSDEEIIAMSAVCRFCDQPQVEGEALDWCVAMAV